MGDVLGVIVPVVLVLVVIVVGVHLFLWAVMKERPPKGWWWRSWRQPMPFISAAGPLTIATVPIVVLGTVVDVASGLPWGIAGGIVVGVPAVASNIGFAWSYRRRWSAWSPAAKRNYPDRLGWWAPVWVLLTAASVAVSVLVLNAVGG